MRRLCVRTRESTSWLAPCAAAVRSCSIVFGSTGRLACWSVVASRRSRSSDVSWNRAAVAVNSTFHRSKRHGQSAEREAQRIFGEPALNDGTLQFRLRLTDGSANVSRDVVRSSSTCRQGIHVTNPRELRPNRLQPRPDPGLIKRTERSLSASFPHRPTRGLTEIISVAPRSRQRARAAASKPSLRRVPPRP